MSPGDETRSRDAMPGSKERKEKVAKIFFFFFLNGANCHCRPQHLYWFRSQNSVDFSHRRLEDKCRNDAMDRGVPWRIPGVFRN